MNTDKTITITIDTDGSSDIDLEGFEVKGCSKVVEDFRGGDAVTVSQSKSEFYVETAKQQVSQRR